MARKIKLSTDNMGLSAINDGCKQNLDFAIDGHDSVSNHQHHDCLLNRLFRRRSKKTSKLFISALEPRQNSSHFRRHLTWCYVHEWKLYCIYGNSFEICFQGFNWQQVTIGSDNGLVLTTLRASISIMIIIPGVSWLLFLIHCLCVVVYYFIRLR